MSDDGVRFEGLDPRECSEHRTLGPSRLVLRLFGVLLPNLTVQRM